jgi:CheY-like chemotaxis protein
MAIGAARLLHPAGLATRPHGDAPQPLLSPRQAARHVAVCDDDIRFIRFVERLLEEAGATVCPVTTLDPHDVVRVVAEAGCDAIMVDLHIYNDDQAGLTLVRLFREHASTRGLPLLLVTGAPPRDLKRHEDFLREYRCGLLPKPFASDALLGSFGLALDGARSPDSVASPSPWKATA